MSGDVVVIHTGNYQERHRRLRRHLFDEQGDERQQSIYIALNRLQRAHWNDRRSEDGR